MRRCRFVISRNVVALIGIGTASIGLPPVVWAQETANAPKNNPISLAECLPMLDWNPAERGPLLIVAPERARLANMFPVHTDMGVTYRSLSGEPVEPVVPGPNGYRLATIAPRYHRKIAPVGGLSTVVPETMAVLRYNNLPEPDLWGGTRPDQRVGVLLATLTPAQWKRLQSGNGIGFGDLDRTQRNIFIGLFPEGTKVYRTDPPGENEKLGKRSEVPLGGVSVPDLRLRLFQELSWSFNFLDAKRGTLSMGVGGQETANGEPSFSLQFPQKPVESTFQQESDSFMGMNQPVAFGVPLMESKPNRAKIADLDYDAAVFDAPVSLTDAKQIKEVIARVHTATGVELYTDNRYAELSVYWVGRGTARAGDVLKAVALGVTGTYRRVVNGKDVVFVLTDDRIGSGARFATIGEWLEGAARAVRKQQQSVWGGIQASEADKKAPWALSESMAPSLDVLDKLSRAPLAKDEKEKQFAVKDLPPGVQKVIAFQLKDWNQRLEENKGSNDTFHIPLRNDTVQLASRLRLACVIPGIGTVPLSEQALRPEMNYRYPEAPFRYIPPPDRNVTLPLVLKSFDVPERGLIVAPTTDTEAVAAAHIATRWGLNRLVLVENGIAPMTLAGWVSAVHTAAPTVEVYLQSPLLWRSIPVDPSPTENSIVLLADRNVRDETIGAYYARETKQAGAWVPHQDRGEYLNIGDPRTQDQVTARVAQLTAIPFVKGIILTDLLAPGYKQANDWQPRRIAEGGYTVSMRQAFLREAGTDPVDLSPYGNLSDLGQGPTGYTRVNVQLPFFPDLGPNVAHMNINGNQATTMGAKDAYPRWNAFREQRGTLFLQKLHDALDSKPSSTELLVRDTTWNDYVTTWQKPAESKPGTTAATIPQRGGLVCFSFAEPKPEERGTMRRSEWFARQLATQLTQLFTTKPGSPPAPKQKSGGYLLDLTAAPISEAEELLRDIATAP